MDDAKGGPISLPRPEAMTSRVEILNQTLEGKDQASMTNATAIMICGHGSRDVEAVNQFNRLAVHLREMLPDHDVESGFLEFARPIIHEGLEKLKERGAKRIVCVPGMLFAAGHVKNDLPSEVNEFGAANPEIEMLFGRDLGIDPKLLKAAQARIEEAEAAAGQVAREDTLLLVVGRGTNDSDANSNVSKVARMLWEGMGFGWAEVGYSGVAHPRTDAALERAVKLGFKRVVVFPYFLFTGVLVGRIYDAVDAVAANHPDVEVLKASYLNDHRMVLESFKERVFDTLDGNRAMNCQLCKYREQIIGFEGDVGRAQVGHHHHVRGVGTDAGHHHHHHDHHRRDRDGGDAANRS